MKIEQTSRPPVGQAFLPAIGAGIPGPILVTEASRVAVYRRARQARMPAPPGWALLVMLPLLFDSCARLPDLTPPTQSPAAQAVAPTTQPHRVLTVCADPNN